MVTKKESLPHSRIRLTITATANDFRHAFDEELKAQAPQVNVQGFRPGKAPEAKVLEKIGRARIESGALERVINDTYVTSVREVDISPVDAPHVNIIEYAAPSQDIAAEVVIVTFTAEVDVLPEVKIDGYKKIKLKKLSEPKIESEEVDKIIDYLRKQQAELKDAPEGTELKNEMWADITYEGSIDGVKRTDMANVHHPLIIGEGQLIPGFEDQILGMKVGDTRTINVTFPKDYAAKELAGKKAVFEVTANEIKNVELPAKDDTFASHFGHNTYAELLEAIRKNLHEEKQEESKRSMEEQVLEQLIQLSHFDAPASLVEQELDRMFKESQDRLAKMKFQWDTYLQQVGKTAEEVKEEMRPQAEKNVKIGLSLGKIMEDENIPQGDGAGRQAVEFLLKQAVQ
jgi:trigger factor